MGFNRSSPSRWTAYPSTTESHFLTPEFNAIHLQQNRCAVGVATATDDQLYCETVYSVADGIDYFIDFEYQKPPPDLTWTNIGRTFDPMNKKSGMDGFSAAISRSNAHNLGGGYFVYKLRFTMDRVAGVSVPIHSTFNLTRP